MNKNILSWVKSAKWTKISWAEKGQPIEQKYFELSKASQQNETICLVELCQPKE